MEAREIIRKDMEALYLGNLNTVEFNLNLPKKGNTDPRSTGFPGMSVSSIPREM